MDAHPGGSSSSPELHPTLLSNMYRNAPFGIPPLKDPLPLKSDGQPDFTQRLIKNVHQPPKPPSDEEFWLPDTFPRCPDAAFLRRHFHREGRLQEHQALWILEEGRRLMKEEPNVLEVEAPVTIVGDIHGQFYDLMTLMKPAIGGSPSTTRYLFLGDYVDRGCFGIECLLFLLALKICHQGNYLLLRGNHESQHLTNYFTFRLECQKKYSEAVYNASVLAFQAMPLAAIVNNQFFCVHGGLSPELQTIDDLQKLHRICEPGSSGMICDILWADPAKNWKAGGPPFQTNPTRGCSYIYGYEAVKMFLDRNHLKLMIRAHEAQAHGFMRHDIPGVAPHLMTIFSAPNYCDVHGNLGAILKYDGKAISVRQFNHVEHPFWLPNFQDVFAWSLPFVAEKAVEMLNSLLDVYPDAEFSEYSASPQSSLVTPPMDLDEDQVLGVVPNTHRRKGHFTALQEGGTKLAEVYKLLREQSEDVGEIRLPVLDTVEEERRQRRRRNTLEVWGGGNLDMGTWNYDQIREQDIINERMPPPLIDRAAKTYYIDNEVRPAPPMPDSPRHFTLGSLTDSPSSNMRTLTLSDTPYSSFAYDSTAGYEAGSSIRSPSPRRGTMVLGPTTGTTYTSSPSMRKRSVEDMDALMRQISSEVREMSLRK